MKMEHGKFIIGVILVIASIVIVAGLYTYYGDETNERNLPPGVENITRIQSKGILESAHRPAEVSSGIVFPSVPEKMVVYQVERNISEDEIVKIASRLGIHGEIHRDAYRDLKIISMAENGWVITGLLTSASIDYSNATPERGYTPDYIDAHLPSDEEAKKIADEFLDRHDIRPEDAVFYSTTHNIGHFISPNEDVKLKNSESINVWYKRWIGDYMVLTDKLYVQVGVHGEVRGMFREWPAYEPYREFPIIGPEEAFGYLRDAAIVIPDGMKNPEKATVTKVSLVYIDHTLTEDLDYFIPVYYFQGVVQGDGKSAAFYQYIPATPEFAAEITGK